MRSLIRSLIIAVALWGNTAHALIPDHRYALLYWPSHASGLEIYNSYDTLKACQIDGALLSRANTPKACNLPGGGTADVCTRVTFCLDQYQQIWPDGPHG